MVQRWKQRLRGPLNSEADSKYFLPLQHCIRGETRGQPGSSELKARAPDTKGGLILSISNSDAQTVNRMRQSAFMHQSNTNGALPLEISSTALMMKAKL